MLRTFGFQEVGALEIPRPSAGIDREETLLHEVGTDYTPLAILTECSGNQHFAFCQRRPDVALMTRALGTNISRSESVLSAFVLLGWRSLRRNPLRSLLTSLGVTVGVGVVVTTMTLGKIAAAGVREQIAGLGPNTIQLRPGRGLASGGAYPPEFNLEDAQQISAQVPGASEVAPVANTSSIVSFEGMNWSTTVNGTTRAYFRIQPWAFESGNFWTETEESAGSAVCVVGSTVRRSIFRQRDPVGSRMRVGNLACRIVGALTTRGQAGFGFNLDDMVLMPIATVQRRLTGNEDVRLILIGVDPVHDNAVVQNETGNLLRERRKLTMSQDDDFSIVDTRQIADTLASITALLTLFVAGVASVSLVLSGIGIMNVMLATVTERTREIAIRLAIGAVERDILMQFLFEATAVSCLGGTCGLLVSQGVIAVLVIRFSLPWSFDLTANISGLGAAVLVGVISGYLPARRAAKLNVIDGLRSA